MDKKPIGAIHSEIGRRIKERRDEMGLNQTDIGRVAGVSQQQIGKYEDGTNRVKLERPINIARALQVQPGYLLDTIAPMIASSNLPMRSRSVTGLCRPLRYADS
ncbi:helix-turn-helix transcriptional regulator [Bosea vestrisii]|uniref:helix-turn-helix domain-containing protein n=1 Tax=Bosea vestrisii TaxID=151416 RepID=UPI0024E04078|nr:helix-turn-helix transcriptional regulator [Bosea vestrisii]WID94917.1 helix-turn-helix transcriptional regulator [Bosea vestrisii]